MVRHLGKMSYSQALKLLYKRIVGECILRDQGNFKDTLLLVEHDPQVYPK